VTPKVVLKATWDPVNVPKADLECTLEKKYSMNEKKIHP
jgi:hypothetical protein